MIYATKRALIERLIQPGDVVLDVGFRGQGIKKDSGEWPHALLKARAADVYGLDLALDPEYENNDHYRAANAEEFEFPISFDVIFAGDLIEHLSNPGRFLERCRTSLKSGGRLILTTPNTFNLFNMTEKLTKREPTVNPDHTMYLNEKTLRQLLSKNGMQVADVGFLYTLGYEHRESWKKKMLNILYAFLARFTDKFVETLVVVAKAA
ncbi:MAG: class I SAM-dependent methyltransferase [Candidatus Kaiserbacteria bacterium]|nr:class I SAM-dependent methyltransferase [Candidatus Kaiserbacteria bacterium]